MKKTVTIVAAVVAVMFFVIWRVFRVGTPETLQEAYSQYVQCDGARIHYKSAGTGDLTLVYVHGFGCDLEVWAEQYEHFRSDRHIRQIFVDLPGYGLSDKPKTDYTPDLFAKAVKAVADKAAPGSKVVLIGHSLGTPVCRQFAFLYPELTLGLVDVDGVYGLYPPDSSSDYEAQIRAFVESFHGPDREENIRLFVYSLAGPDTPEEIGSYALEHMPNTPEYVAYSTMKNLVDRRYWDGQTLSIPVLITCTRNSGLEDDNREQMQRLYPAMRDSDYWELETCGHFIQWEASHEFNSRLDKFLEDVR